MKRRSRVTKRLTLKMLVFAAVCAAGVGTALAATTVTVKTVHTAKLGTIVVNGQGRTLYHLTGERNGAIKCKGACLGFWPPLIVAAGTKAQAGTGIVAAKLGTVKRPDGRLQVTYNHMPLYRFAHDTKAGQTNGEAFPDGALGTWYAISRAGTIVKPHAAMTTTTTSSSTTTTTTGYGYGAGGP
jgi:predicted lipoprotein with Yx(FWY)xxD motif